MFCSNNPLQIFSLPQLIKTDLSDYEGEGKKQERDKEGRHTNTQRHVSHSHMYITDAEFRQPVLLRTGVTR